MCHYPHLLYYLEYPLKFLFRLKKGYQESLLIVPISKRLKFQKSKQSLFSYLLKELQLIFHQNLVSQEHLLAFISFINELYSISYCFITYYYCFNAIIFVYRFLFCLSSSLVLSANLSTSIICTLSRIFYKEFYVLHKILLLVFFKVAYLLNDFHQCVYRLTYNSRINGTVYVFRVSSILLLIKSLMDFLVPSSIPVLVSGVDRVPVPLRFRLRLNRCFLFNLKGNHSCLFCYFASYIYFVFTLFISNRSCKNVFSISIACFLINV